MIDLSKEKMHNLWTCYINFVSAFSLSFIDFFNDSIKEIFCSTDITSNQHNNLHFFKNGKLSFWHYYLCNISDRIFVFSTI